MKRTYTHIPKDLSSSSDLMKTASTLSILEIPYETGWIYIYEQGRGLHPEVAEYLFVPSLKRLGITWRTSTGWALIDTINRGIEAWLLDLEWEDYNQP